MFVKVDRTNCLVDWIFAKANLKVWTENDFDKASNLNKSTNYVWFNLARYAFDLNDNTLQSIEGSLVSVIRFI